MTVIPQTLRSPQAGDVQCLGGMPWIGRATASKPDIGFIATVRAIVKETCRSETVSVVGFIGGSAVALMTETFAAHAANPKLSHAEALQKSILTMIGDAKHPERADPKYWAPFVVVGEPAK